MSTNEQILPPTSLALQPAQQSLERVRESESRLNQFILDSIRFTEESTAILKSAGEFIVDSEAAMQVADVAQATLKRDVSQWDSQRMVLTRPLDDLKSAVMDPSRDGVINLKAAIDLYQSKVSTYRTVKRLEAEAAQREAERIVREQKERQETEARKLEEKAATLKTPARAEALMREADEIRQVAAMMPDSVALAVSEPKTVASNVAEIWEVEKIENTSDYLRWLAEHPEWHCVLNFKTSEHNRLAKQFHAIGIPGLRFGRKDSFRSKAR